MEEITYGETTEAEVVAQYVVDENSPLAKMIAEERVRAARRLARWNQSLG